MSVHECRLQSEIKEVGLPTSVCLEKLLECIEPELYGPVTTEQCLRRHGHAKICIKDPSEESKYNRTVQAAFLEQLFAEKWSQPLITSCIKKLSHDNSEALRFLRDIPGKTRKEHDYTNDKALFRAIKNSKDSELILETFDMVLATQKSRPIVTAFSELLGTNQATRQPIIDKAIATILATSTSREENVKLIKISNTLISHFDRFVPKEYKTEWAAFKIMMEERHRVADQLHNEILCYAYSTSQKKAVEQEYDLYEHLEKLTRSEEPAECWKRIPDQVKREFALSFTAVLHSLIALPATNVAPQVYKELLAEFTASCSALSSTVAAAMKSMTVAVNLLNRVAASINSGVDK